MPYTGVIDIYNEAGEKIKSIGSTLLLNPITDLVLVENSNTTTVYDPKDGSLDIRVPGQGTDGKQYIDFTWDGSNNNGQDIVPGIYYIKMTITDPYGSGTAVVEAVQVVEEEVYTRISIYNSAGELVKRVQVPEVETKVINLQVDDVFYAGGNSSTTIKYGNTGTLVWDGTNSMGDLVGSGTYEVVVEEKTADGYDAVASKTITVLDGSGPSAIGQFKIEPNPVVVQGGVVNPMKFAWDGTEPGDVTIKIYNIAGELIKMLGAKVGDGSVQWDLKTSNGYEAASGFYIVVVEDKTDSGKLERKITKLVIIRKL